MCETTVGGGAKLNLADNRQAFLDQLDDLISRNETKEAEVHKAIETNLWVLGKDFEMIASNKTLKDLIAGYLQRKFGDSERENKRPDLLLAEMYGQEVLLVEFKRPQKTVGRDDENQAEKYRDDIIPYLGERKIKVQVIGGRVDVKVKSVYSNNELVLSTYRDVVSRARSRLGWLLTELKTLE